MQGGLTSANTRGGLRGGPPGWAGLESGLWRYRVNTPPELGLCAPRLSGGCKGEVAWSEACPLQLIL